MNIAFYSLPNLSAEHCINGGNLLGIALFATTSTT